MNYREIVDYLRMGDLISLYLALPEDKGVVTSYVPTLLSMCDDIEQQLEWMKILHRACESNRTIYSGDEVVVRGQLRGKIFTMRADDCKYLFTLKLILPKEGLPSYRDLVIMNGARFVELSPGSGIGKIRLEDEIVTVLNNSKK